MGPVVGTINAQTCLSEWIGKERSTGGAEGKAEPRSRSMTVLVRSLWDEDDRSDIMMHDRRRSVLPLVFLATLLVPNEGTGQPAEKAVWALVMFGEGPQAPGTGRHRAMSNRDVCSEKERQSTIS